MSTVLGTKKESDLVVVPEIMLGRKQRVEGLVLRDARFEAAIEDEEKRLVRVSFSSEEPYLRRSWWEDPWIEVLGHKADEVDLTRLNNRAAVLYNHRRTREDRIGATIEASVNGTRSSALIQLSERDDIDDIWGDLRSGLLCNVSVAYNIHERILVKQNDDGPDEYRVTSWEPVEISLVDIPADPTVGVGRIDGVEHLYRVFDLDSGPAVTGNKGEGSEMPPKDKKPTGDETRGENDNDQETVSNTVAEELAEKAAQKAAKQATDKALDQESTRQSEIQAVFDGQEATKETAEILKKCIHDQDVTVQQARELLLDEIGRGKKAAGVGNFQPGQDAADKFRDMATNNLESRALFKDVKIDGDSDLAGFSLPELARACLSFNDLDSTGRTMDMVGRALTMRASGIGHTPSDFAQILLNVAAKQALIGFAETPETWMQWCRVGNLSDFKQASRVGLSQFEDLELIGPGGEYKYGTLSDKGETIQLASYGKIFAIARQTIINDDLSMLLRAPQLMGRAAARVPGDLAYIVLTSNALLADGVALFAAGHNNLGTGGVISVVTVGEARELMALQSDISGNSNGSNILLEFLLVPVQLEDVANVLRTSEFDPDNANQSRAPNPRRNTFKVVGEPRLSADNVTQWYATAGPSMDTVEVAFLDGIQEPRIEEKEGWTVDGAEFKVALDVAAAPMEHRTFVRNAGV